MAAEIGFHLNQVWYAEVAPGKALSDREAMALAAEAGAGAVRYDFNWRDYQESSDAAFDAEAFALGEREFARYLVMRGYGENGDALASVYAELQEAASLGLKTIFNLNTIPDWAKRFPNEPYKGLDHPAPRAFLLNDNRRVGEFLHDFIIMCARKPNGEGLAVLKSIQGFQIFNEIAGWTQQYNPGYGFYAERQLPYDEYFEILDHAMALKQMAFAAIGVTKNVPPVLGPNLGGTHVPAFWRAAAKYVPRNPSTTAENGKLRLEGISLHPYGITVRPGIDLERESAEAADYFGVNHAYSLTGNNMTFSRVMQPTDDWLWMLSMIDRDLEKSKAWSLYRYSDVPDPARQQEPEKRRQFTADLYYDESPELGVERTLALLNDLGLATAGVHFTEFGGSSYPGNDSADSLFETTFADPYRYGFVPNGKKLDKELAETLQAEAVLQTLGLIESWDFTKTATAYTIIERAGTDNLDYFGLARNTLSKNGKLQMKPAGLLFKAFLNRQSLSLVNAVGVDLHLAGTGKRLRRKPENHEVILLREGADEIEGAAGDDIIFAGSGNNTVSGGEGYDKLYGGYGNDTLSGGEGNDRLKGEAGDDTLTGGPGRDNYVFSAYAKEGSGNPGHDIITDFDPKADRVTLIGLVGERLDLPKLMQATAEGVLLTWSAYGSTILFRGNKLADFSAKNFHVLK